MPSRSSVANNDVTFYFVKIVRNVSLNNNFTLLSSESKIHLKEQVKVHIARYHAREKPATRPLCNRLHPVHSVLLLLL